MKKAYIIFVIALLCFLPNKIFAEQFTLIRASVMYSDGTIVDSLQSGWDISGTMSIVGDRVTQTITVCGLSCVTVTVSATLLYFGENEHSVTVRDDNGIISELILLNGTNLPIATFLNTSCCAEVDQWMPSSFLQNTAEEVKIDISNSVSFHKPGGLLGELLKIAN